MISTDSFRQIALDFPEAVELPHFEKASFRVRKRIFATLTEENRKISLKLSPVDQNVFCSHNATMIYPVPNKWGLQGWTFIELDQVPEDVLRDALTTAYCTVAPKRLVQVVRPESNPSHAPGKDESMKSIL
jgi:hypothetical protein